MTGNEYAVVILNLVYQTFLITFSSHTKYVKRKMIILHCMIAFFLFIHQILLNFVINFKSDFNFALKLQWTFNQSINVLRNYNSNVE